MYSIFFGFVIVNGVGYSQETCKKISDFGGEDLATNVFSSSWTEDCSEILRIRDALWEGRPVVISEALDRNFYIELREQFKAAKGWFKVGAPVQIRNAIFDTDADDLCGLLYSNSHAAGKPFEFSSNYIGDDGVDRELPNLAELDNVMNDPAITAFVEYLIDIPRWSERLGLERELDHLLFEGAGPFNFRKDDYYSLHNDWNKNRAVSFTLYITEDVSWTSKGGRFGWCGADGTGVNSENVFGSLNSSTVQWIPPASNKMILFRIAMDSMHFVEKVMEEPTTPRFSVQARYGFPNGFKGNDKPMDPWHKQVVQNMVPLEVPFKVRIGKMKTGPQMENSAPDHNEL